MKRAIHLLVVLLPMMLLLALPASAAVDGAPVASSGCGDASAAAPQARGSLEIAGEERRWRTTVPSKYDGSTPMPLVLWLHGQGMDAASVDDWTDLASAAERFGFVSVAPQGHAPDAGWMWEPATADVPLSVRNRDIAFIDALIDRLAVETCIDLSRVYATGFSIGGHGVMALACALGGRIAAVAPAAMYSDLGTACVSERPVPVLAIDQTADEYVLWDGGLGDFLSDRLPWGTTKGEEPFFTRPDWSRSAIDRVESVAVRNGCQPGPAAEPVAEAVDRLVWTCPDQADVELIVVDGGEHAWLIESAPASTSDLMWSFFERFALP